jgi:hypothetical protein
MKNIKIILVIVLIIIIGNSKVSLARTSSDVYIIPSWLGVFGGLMNSFIAVAPLLFFAVFITIIYVTIRKIRGNKQILNNSDKQCEEKNNYIEKSNKYKNRFYLFFSLAVIAAALGGLVTNEFMKSSDMGGFAIFFFLPLIGVFFLISLYYIFKHISIISKNTWRGALSGIMLAIIAYMILYLLVLFLII